MKNYIIADLACTVAGDTAVVGENYAPFEVDIFPDSCNRLFELEVDTTTCVGRIDWGAIIDDYPDESLRIEVRKGRDNFQMVSYLPESDTAFSVIECNSHYTQNTLYILDLEQAEFAFNNAMMLLYACAAAQQGNTLLFHSSVIVKDAIAYLFLGKSGTGKSTHTGLWLQHISQTHRLNDDNPVVRILPDEVRAYGSPWSGKTPCYRNESFPVGAIVRLWQAPENKIQRLRPAQAFAALLPTVSSLPCSVDITTAVREAITKLIERTPVYRMDCLPDEAAAQLSFNTISNP